MMTDPVEDLHRKSRLHYYESGERASKLLSHQLRQSVATSFITEIGLVVVPPNKRVLMHN